MLANKKKISTALAALSLIALVACDTDEIKYPSNYTEKMIDKDITDNNNSKVPTAQDTLKQYYQSLTNDDTVYEKTANKVLTILADNVHGITSTSKDYKGGNPCYAVTNDTVKNTSVADSYKPETYKTSGTDNLKNRAKDTMLSTAKGGSYKKDNMWSEAKYAEYLKQNYYYLDTVNTSNDVLANKLVTPTMTYEEAYNLSVEGNNSAAYDKYMETELFDDNKINYLTTEYIIQKTPSSIGNANARKVQVVGIVDRSDETGDAIKLLTAYVNTYILGSNESLRDPDFSVLSRLWKGITVESLTELSPVECELEDFTFTDGGHFILKIDSSWSDIEKAELTKYFARYGVTFADDGTINIASGSPVMTYAETKWFNDNNLDVTETLMGSILSDKEKIDDGLSNWHKIDSSLESTYTGSYTYDLATGYRNAIDELVTRDLTTSGTYLKSSGISSLPSGLTDRIFSTKVTSEKDKVDSMKKDITDGKSLSHKEDLTCYAKDNYRYMTVADTITSNDVSSILYYDSSSKTYYITRILDVVDTNALSSESNSIYDTEEKKNQIKWEVAYQLSTTGSYKTDSAVYWFSRMDFSYSDEDFLEYMKSNYKDVFKTENPYASETKISLKNFIA